MRIWTAMVLALLVGCTTTDPYTGEQKTSNTAKGAAVGAVAGAVLGAAAAGGGERKKGAVVGAVAGGAVGAGIGQYMDRQERALRERLAGSGVQVVREGDHLRLVMPGHVTFDVDSDAIRPEFFQTLVGVAEVLKKFDRTRLQIAGHTDSTGSDAYNQALSERRAAAVARFLESQGIAPGRIVTVGYGERYPIADNATPEGRALNRRVELEIIPLQ
ncbi:MAG: OmpA family lipoprotein [Porticoccaceae bacterium]|nr:MAG: OmpA family lipoprotein [Porticoccaceae bacterium]